MNDETSKDLPDESKAASGSFESLANLERIRLFNEFIRKSAAKILESDAPRFTFDPSHQLRSGIPSEIHRLFIDESGNLRFADAGEKDEINLTISRAEFDRLTAKTQEILSVTSIARERIAKDREDIDLLKSETRQALRRLRA